MCLEESISREEFGEDAADTPDITRETPAQIQNDFRGTIVSGRHDGRMILVIERCGAEVDEPNLAIQQYTPLPCTPRGSVRG